ncbi:DUF2848 domain-containing protein [Enhydrobacter sp.]|jgi:hypothetical protein|uniref:DUF2848 domain-containing protein n=1 Tax=Enhydrobacter sp. TaxID=1894999 RepID=UPI002621C5E1|nr:DUF2848 domain-containing protein [Enhydrobacter sp.]WIM11290.1 MAG: hypothetical protein OJF58_002247 [Enhydrobacter sp.]
MARLAFDWRDVDIDELVIAGWTGRDVAALQRHIEELKAIGVEPPSKVPLYYRLASGLLTQAERIQVLGEDTSGEAEPVLLGTPDRLWVTVGSDHTDRKVESYGVAVAKQLCPKVLARTAWRFEEVEPHWDRLVLRAFVEEEGRKVLYQEGTLAALRPPRELIAGWRGSPRLPPRVALFCGTLPAIGAIRSSPRFTMELDDPVLGRKLAHAYAVEALPLVT